MILEATLADPYSLTVAGNRRDQVVDLESRRGPHTS